MPTRSSSLALLRDLNPLFGEVAMSASSLLVVFNSLRLRRGRDRVVTGLGIPARGTGTLTPSGDDAAVLAGGPLLVAG